MNPWIEISSAIVGLAHIVLLIGVGSSLVEMTWYRRRNRIAVQPQLTPTRAEEMPQIFRGYLGQLTKALREAGFTAVANLIWPTCARVGWIQVVFAKPDTCDRVSCICQFHSRVISIVYIFVTDAADGSTVSTSVGGSTEGIDVETSHEQAPTLEVVARAYHIHRKKVDEQLRGKSLVKTPPDGQEIPWLSTKLAAVAKSYAQQFQLTITMDRRWYVPTWKDAWHATWRRSWPIRIVYRRKIPAQGFPVVAQSPTDAQ
jgi:hypothetical protein